MTSDPLAESIRYCRSLARRAGRNFYWSFLTLPRPLYRDMCVLYAFMRVTDDLGDEETRPVEERLENLDAWRQSLARVMDGGAGERTEWAATLPREQALVLWAVRDLHLRRHLPAGLLLDVIDGVASDLTPRRFETFAQLERYCYQVAGAVGLCCIRIWGFTGEVAPARAVDCGTAFQLTNILRDLGEDARRGRLYLPQEDLDRFSCTQDEIQQGGGAGFRHLMEFETARAREYYRRGAELFPCLDRSGRTILAAMFRIYGGLLDEIERRNFDVFSRRVELSGWSKFRAALGAWLRPLPVLSH
jgi:phytoene synthase